MKHSISKVLALVVCFMIGVAIAYFLYGEFTYQNTLFLPFALFMGIAMSIAAFPVMARIVHERGINKTPLGSTIITCAAVDDMAALHGGSRCPAGAAFN